MSAVHLHAVHVFYPDTLWRVMSANPWFSALSGKTQEELIGGASLQNVAKGRVVVRGGGQGALVGLVRGALMIAGDTGSPEVAIDVIEPGQWFGHLGTSQGGDAYVLRAMRASTVLTMDEGTLQRLWHSCPDIPEAFARLNWEMARRMLERFENAAACTYRDKVRGVLVLLARRFGVARSDGWQIVPVKFNQSEIAALARVSRARTNEVMGDLAERGLIRNRKDGIEVNTALAFVSAGVDANEANDARRQGAR